MTLCERFQVMVAVKENSQRYKVFYQLLLYVLRTYYNLREIIRINLTF